MWMGWAIGAAWAGSVVQLQVDLFDMASPGAGLWASRVALDDDGGPTWQVFVAGGQFDHYHPGELASVGWGRAGERRRYVRVGAHAYLWRGLFVGGHAEALHRGVREPGGDTTAGGWTPTIQPAIGYNLQPWGFAPGRGGLMLWVAPRVPFVRETFEVAGESYGIAPVEFASGLNLTVSL